MLGHLQRPGVLIKNDHSAPTSSHALASSHYQCVAASHGDVSQYGVSQFQPSKGILQINLDEIFRLFHSDLSTCSHKPTMDSARGNTSSTPPPETNVVSQLGGQTAPISSHALRQIPEGITLTGRTVVSQLASPLLQRENQVLTREGNAQASSQHVGEPFELCPLSSRKNSTKRTSSKHLPRCKYQCDQACFTQMLCMGGRLTSEKFLYPSPRKPGRQSSIAPTNPQ